MFTARSSPFKCLREAPVAVLLDALGADDPAIRREAAELCGEYKIHAAKDLLLASLGDIELCVIEAAALALALLQDKSAVAALHASYSKAKARNQGYGKNHWNSRQFSTIGVALCSFYSTDELLNWFATGDDDDRCVIAGVFAQRGGSLVIPFLQRALDTSSDEVRSAINSALGILSKNSSSE